MNIKIKDKNFAHADLVGNGNLKISAENLQWYRGNEIRDISCNTNF